MIKDLPLFVSSTHVLYPFIPVCPFFKFLDKLYPIKYIKTMIEILQTENYRKWFDKLKDRNARARIDIRLRRLSLGNYGDAKSVGEGVSELRIDYGPGYRVYFTKKGARLIILLAGGDKTTQAGDIEKAKKLVHEIEV
ncbi:MAG: type II toxin-antitoxin system RelE/ParE family toxin [Smithellaceae bacterium]|nr:type II toxin-antitoxin system RelE/ParE family toxin [Smithellaceae bacterium]